MITIINSDKQKQLDWCVNGNKSMITQTIKNKIRDIIQASKEIESVALSAGEKNPLSTINFTSSIINCLSISFSPVRENGTGDIMLRVNRSKLKDGLTEGLNGRVMTDSRDTLHNARKDLSFLNELLTMPKDMEGIARVDFNKSRLTELNWQDVRLVKNKYIFLKYVIKEGIQQFLEGVADANVKRDD